MENRFLGSSLTRFIPLHSLSERLSYPFTLVTDVYCFLSKKRLGSSLCVLMLFTIEIEPQAACPYHIPRLFSLLVDFVCFLVTSHPVAIKIYVWIESSSKRWIISLLFQVQSVFWVIVFILASIMFSDLLRTLDLLVQYVEL